MFASKDLFFSKPSGYQISRSVRLRSSASAYLNRTFGTPTDSTKFTWSAWVKRGALNGVRQGLIGRYIDGNNSFRLMFDTNDTLLLNDTQSASTKCSVVTNAVFRDPSAWYHIVLAIDTSNGTAANRQIIYVNGVQQTFSSATNYSTGSLFNIASAANTLGLTIDVGPVNKYLDGYLTEINFIDGQALTPSSFGETNTITGVWQPKKYTGTYGTNGFYLNFSDNSNNTATTIGKDYSGNGNNWTPNNISVTAGATYDSMLDVPTLFADGGNGRGNYAVLNPLDTNTTGTLRWGNLDSTGTSSATGVGSILITSGKWYAEATIVNRGGTTTAGTGFYIYTASGITRTGLNPAGTRRVDGVDGAALSAAIANGDVIGLALDADAKTLGVYLNGSLQGTLTFTDASPYTFNNDVRVSGATTNPDTAVNFGQQGFKYTPPTGFVALNTQNLPTPAISNGANYFAATTYTGTGASLAVSNTVNGISFAPDFVWIKSRPQARSHRILDTIRGVTNTLFSDQTAAETVNTNGVTAFNSNGFTVGTDINYNNSAETYIGWQWKEGATQGFDIVTWTQANPSTLSHNLGVTPAMIIIKGRGTTDNWVVWHKNLTNTTTYALQLNTTAAQFSSATLFNSTAPTSTQFTVGTGAVTNGTLAVAYCFSEVAGYSKFGSYTGNGSADGTFVYCGFRPRWVMVKRTDAVGNWQLLDTSRSTYNVSNANLYPNLSNAEVTGGNEDMDILSNGFKPRNASASFNVNTGTYIFVAFAENPFKNSLAR
jgi:hypothetical protein